jgi:Na+/H+ antiporter NhaD/arsenite permease-like protein
VANAGGMLTPLGDPPLFLLYLRGAPFEWFFHLTPEWAFVNFILILIYFVVDTYHYKKEPLLNVHRDMTQIEPLRIKGTYNFIFLLGIIFSVAFINKKYIPAIEANHYLGFIREAVMMAFAGLSMYFTPKLLREQNKFTWTPIIEVAFLFLGIFVTMVPTLLYLNTHAHTLGIDSATMFYYATGGLSSFLDNAPTALAFHKLAEAMVVNPADPTLVAHIPAEFLTAISLGAVFFGAMTYIGNGPNFMVKAIAEENKIAMPSFFGYMIKFSLIVLLPVYILTQIIFL